jgi:hypothetical protein
MGFRRGFRIALPSQTSRLSWTPGMTTKSGRNALQTGASQHRLRALSARLGESLAAERVPFKRKPLPTDAELVPSDELVAIVRAKYPGPLPEQEAAE